MFVKLDYESIQQFEERVREISKDLRNRFFRECLEHIGNVTKQYAQEISPVGVGTPTPGQLKESWSITSVTRNGDVWNIEVINPAKYDGKPYPLYVEEGHRLMRNGRKIGYVEPFPMIRKAFEEKTQYTQEYLEDKLRELFTFGG